MPILCCLITVPHSVSFDVAMQSCLQVQMRIAVIWAEPRRPLQRAYGHNTVSDEVPLFNRVVSQKFAYGKKVGIGNCQTLWAEAKPASFGSSTFGSFCGVTDSSGEANRIVVELSLPKKKINRINWIRKHWVIR